MELEVTVSAFIDFTEVGDDYTEELLIFMPDWEAITGLVVRVGNITETRAEVSWEVGETLACVESWQLQLCGGAPVAVRLKIFLSKFFQFYVLTSVLRCGGGGREV